MSFKRDGNDLNLLSVLQKRRINDLLSENIPEDEAKLLSNGRFCCLICSSNPVFDTVNMLSVHRKGKKHKSSAEYHEEKKEELRLLIAKRKHDQFMKTGSTSINVASPQPSGISRTSPYDSRVKRFKVKPGDRKPRVNLQETKMDSTVLDSDASMLNESNFKQNSIFSPWQTMCEHQLHGPVTHNFKLKSIFQGKKDEPVKLNPYSSKRKKFDSSIDTTECNHGISNSLSRREFTLDTTKMLNKTDNHSYSFPSTSSEAPPLHSLPLKTSLSSDKADLPGYQQTAKEKELALKYHHLQGSGWKRDWDGKWIKDEQAEFDSDEEPPDLL